MARYQRVSPKFWQDPQVRRWDDRGKLLAQYLLSCPNRTTEGLFWLPKPYIAADLGWGIEGVSEALSELAEAGFAAYHDATETVVLCKALKYEAPAGEKQIAGAIARLADVPPTPLFSLLKAGAAEFAPEFADALDKEAIDGLLKDHARCSEAPSKGYRPSCSNSHSCSEHHGADEPRRDDLDGMPLQAEPSLTFAQTLGRWVVSQGIKLPAKDRKAERYAAVLDCIVAHVPEEHPRRRGVVIAFIADYVADVTGEPPDGDTRGHLARLVGEFSAQAVMHAAGEAVGWGAGIGAEHADDSKAFTKYMARILYGERQTA